GGGAGGGGGRGLGVAACPADSDRTPAAQLSGLRTGRLFGACSCGGSGGALHRGGGTGARVLGARRPDGGAVCGGPVWGFGEPDVPDRGPWAVGGGRGCGGV